MNSQKATFYPDFLASVRNAVIICVIAGVVVFCGFMLQDSGTTNRALWATLITEVVIIPIAIIIIVAGTYNFKIEIYESGIRSPANLQSMPFKCEYIEWSSIDSIRQVKLHFTKYNKIIAKDGRFALVPVNVWKQEEFSENIRKIAQNNRELLKLIEK